LVPKITPLATQSCRNHLLLVTKPTGITSFNKKKIKFDLSQRRVPPDEAQRVCSKNPEIDTFPHRKESPQVWSIHEIEMYSGPSGKDQRILCSLWRKGDWEFPASPTNEPKNENGTRRLDARGHVGSNLYSVKSDVFSI